MPTPRRAAAATKPATSIRTAFALACALGGFGLMSSAVLAGSASPTEDDYKTRSTTAAFADVAEDVKDAIVKRGFIVDYVGQINDMLVRTAVDTGTVTGSGKASPFKHAVFIQFCPSKLTHEAVNASPLAIAACPVAIQVFETTAEPGKVVVGYRRPPASPSKLVKAVRTKLEALLEEIATEATRR
jgi:uncharacterized protein (DUF302 family)